MTAGAHALPRAIRRIAGRACAAATPTRHDGRSVRALRPFFVAPVLALALLASPPMAVAAADGIDEIRAMVRAGAPALALSLLDEAQPAVSEDPAAWTRWERERIAILGRTGAWRRALERLARTPSEAPAEFRLWARERRAEFHLELGQAEPAGELLRALLWRDGRGATETKRQHWRQLVIRAHLVADRVDDAVLALRRFDQDYGDPGPEWAALRTRVLLRAGRAAEAASGLPAERPGELAALAVLARSRARQLDSEEAYQSAVEAASAEGVEPAAAARWWFVAADISGREDNPGRRALATERALAAASSLPPGDELFALDGDDLWSAWLTFGRHIGNNEQLLIGDDEAWFAAAEEAMPQSPVRARSLLAIVAQQGQGQRARAHRRLLDHLDNHGPGLAVGRLAYLDADERYPQLSEIPAGVRYRLVDDALARSDLALASRLLTGLSQAPSDVGPFSWDLMRSRVMIRGERYAEGTATLAQMIQSHPALRGERLDRLLQVTFDLQGAGEHERALALLQRLDHAQLPVQRRRELLYWRAESHQGLEQYREAAALYMRSALLMPSEKLEAGAVPGGDPWGQTARYQAAGMLAKAGLIGDARRIYEDLLRVTDDADRKSTLRHRLRKLPSTEAVPDDLPAGPESGRGSRPRL